MAQIFTSDDAKAILKKHNEYRRQESAADMYLLHWNVSLQQRADSWARRCLFKHEINPDLGENLFYDTNHKNEVFLRGMNIWHKEKFEWMFTSSSCAKSCHYTQIIWSKTTTVGCSAHVCSSLNVRDRSVIDAMFLVCYYYPRGNFIGSFPYARGRPCSKCVTGDVCHQDLCLTSGPESKLAPGISGSSPSLEYLKGFTLESILDSTQESGKYQQNLHLQREYHHREHRQHFENEQLEKEKDHKRWELPLTEHQAQQINGEKLKSSAEIKEHNRTHQVLFDLSNDQNVDQLLVEENNTRTNEPKLEDNEIVKTLSRVNVNVNANRDQIYNLVTRNLTRTYKHGRVTTGTSLHNQLQAYKHQQDYNKIHSKSHKEEINSKEHDMIQSNEKNVQIRRAYLKNKWKYRRNEVKKNEKDHRHKTRYIMDASGQRCVDRHARCEEWSTTCHRNVAVTLACPMTCGKCGSNLEMDRPRENEIENVNYNKRTERRRQPSSGRDNEESTSHLTEPTGEQKDEGNDGYSNGDKLQHEKQRTVGEKQYHTQVFQALCRDDPKHSRSCKFWAVKGFCWENKLTANIYCRHSCSTCQ